MLLNIRDITQMREGEPAETLAAPDEQEDQTQFGSSILQCDDEDVVFAWGLSMARNCGSNTSTTFATDA